MRKIKRKTISLSSLPACHDRGVQADIDQTPQQYLVVGTPFSLMVFDIIDRIPEPQRTMVRLRYAGLTYREIGARLYPVSQSDRQTELRARVATFRARKAILRQVKSIIGNRN
ncbi:hypothetical protein HUU59_12205 [bacterium]|nr:hypothetical protein [bacterium]